MPVATVITIFPIEEESAVHVAVSLAVAGNVGTTTEQVFADNVGVTIIPLPVLLLSVVMTVELSP